MLVPLSIGLVPPPRPIVSDEQRLRKPLLYPAELQARGRTLSMIAAAGASPAGVGAPTVP